MEVEEGLTGLSEHVPLCHVNGSKQASGLVPTDGCCAVQVLCKRLCYHNDVYVQNLVPCKLLQTEFWSARCIKHNRLATWYTQALWARKRTHRGKVMYTDELAEIERIT